MTPKTRRPARSARVEAKVHPRVLEAVEAFARANGCSRSSVVCRVLLEWERGPKRPPTPARHGSQRVARLDAKLEPWLYDTLAAWAAEHGLTLSSAVNCILVAWEKAERRRGRRRVAGKA